MRLRNLTALVLALALAASARADVPEFDKVGVAFLEKHCVSCHGEKTKKADLSLHAIRNADAVLKHRKTLTAAVKAVNGGEMPPPTKPRPTTAEVEAFTQSVNAVFDRHDRDAKPDPGRVTVRRLNRTEYNNTIRDLVGVDFQPAEDFPADDVGHGFDNIGDVLSLSPVLMERYLAAAESVVNRAILVEVPKPPKRALASRWLEPAQQADVRWRPLTSDRLHTPWKLSMDGEYTFRVRAYATSPDDEPVKIALLADRRELQQFEVKATEKTPAVFEATLTLPAGDVRTAVQILNPGDKDPKRTLFVEWFELEGPKDTRPPSHRRLLACSPDKPKREQTQEVVSRFASQAYRRPATPDEVERLVKLVESAEARGETWAAGVQLAVQAVLVSPKFLFRLELDDRPDSPEPHPLDEFQLASRLSYFLWSSMPDQELFDLAGRKALTANLDAQVRRMLQDPKSRALTDNFAVQWLQLGRLKIAAPDAKLFPNFNEDLRSAMLQETKLFFDAVVREDRPVVDLIDADFTFLNERLARHYGIIDTNGNRMGQKPVKPGGQPIRGEKFVRVSLQGGSRGGVLTQASVLTVTSNPTRTSPVKRGKWVLEQLLGTPPPPPPPDVPELDNPSRPLTGSLRTRMEQHRENPSCANCHARMDPIGFGFENYDAVGAFRQKDGEFAIDPSGTLPDGQSFKGPEELKAILKGKKDLFVRNLAEKMMTYALGRGLEHYDKRAVDQVVTATAGDGDRFSALVGAIVRSDPFRLRRGKGGESVP